VPLQLEEGRGHAEGRLSLTRRFFEDWRLTIDAGADFFRAGVTQLEAQLLEV
jgi:hypothetical protein